VAGEPCSALGGADALAEAGPGEPDSAADTAKDSSKAARSGPFIFASCHEDVAAYLQPEFVCICAVGKAPLAFRNKKAPSRLTLHAELKGDLEPEPAHRGYHLLVGHWVAKGQDINPFMINYKGAKANELFRLGMEGGTRVEHLRRSDDPYPKNSGSPWYSGATLPDKGEIRVRIINNRNLVVQQKEGGQLCWSKEMRATRRTLPQPMQALMLARDPESVARGSAVVNYGDFDDGVLQSHGWYLPPELAPDGRYAGLERAQEPQLVSTWDFKYDAKLEKADNHQSFLATYVGEPDGGLSAKLKGVSRLLDCPFDGLCLHRIPKLPPMDDFRIGVITGPSGSGKSTLARHFFGPSPTIDWSPDAPVLSHFDSLASATELLGAADLNLSAAMRPYGALSSGEQSRADLARILQQAAAAIDGKSGDVDPGQALVLDEFTAKVDRPVARGMARGMHRLAQRRSLRRLVVVSCHDDFVGCGMLEPDWLFECHNNRLLRFLTNEAAHVAKAEVPHRDRLLSAQAKLSEAEKEFDLLRTRVLACAATDCFTEKFKEEVAVMGRALSAFGEDELQRQREEVSAAKEAMRRAREAVIERFQAQQEAADKEARPVTPACAVTDEDGGKELEARIARALVPPMLELEIRRALPREWVHFREHHYKDHSLHTASVAFVGILGGQAACFLAIVGEKVNYVQRNAVKVEWADVGYPKTWAKGKVRRLYREHRTVVLPDFQGMGLAPLLCDSVALHVLETGHDFTSQTVHPFYGGYRDRSPFWRALPSNRKENSQINGNYKFSHVFVGAVRPNGQTDPQLATELNSRISRRTELARSHHS